jgi:hypothetical protein
MQYRVDPETRHLLERVITVLEAAAESAHESAAAARGSDNAAAADRFESEADDTSARVRVLRMLQKESILATSRAK